MNRTAFSTIALLFMMTLAPVVQADPSTTQHLFLDFEGGLLWQTRNDVQIPNDITGTRFGLVDVIGNGPWSVTRLYVTWNVSENHGLRLLLGPLHVAGTAELEAPVDFAGSSFVAGTPTKATYKFNSWRITYRYRFHGGEHWRWWIGVTAKIRDAKIRLAQAAKVAEKTDVGFVPLLHLDGDWRIAAHWTAELDIDALAGGPGRAEDASVRLRYNFDDRWSMAGGYRTVEGGADVNEVYNFAWLHYAVISVRLAF